MVNTRGNILVSTVSSNAFHYTFFSLFRRRAHEAWDGQASMSWGSRWCGIHCQWYHTWTRYRNTLKSCTPVLTLWVLRMIRMKFLIVMSMLYKWSWELKTWSQNINLNDNSTRIWILIIGFKELSGHPWGMALWLLKNGLTLLKESQLVSRKTVTERDFYLFFYQNKWKFRQLHVMQTCIKKDFLK